jgi:hypothetical protein
MKLKSLKERAKRVIFGVPFLGGWIEERIFRSRWKTELRLLDGEDFSESSHPSILHLSLTRSASQWVKSVLRRCAVPEGLVHVRWNEMAFSSDYPFLDRLDSVGEYKRIFHDEGYLYSAFGGYPVGIPDLEKFKVVLVVRDPRDILVSRYFSKRDSHGPPPPESNKRQEFLRDRAFAREVSIDEYVLEKRDQLLKDYNCYLDRLLKRHSHIHVTRYEDMVADVETWLDQLLSYVELSHSQELRREIIEEALSIQSKEEDKMAHNRKGRPGDHREKLQPATVKELNHVFGHVLDRFGYN